MQRKESGKLGAGRHLLPRLPSSTFSPLDLDFRSRQARASPPWGRDPDGYSRGLGGCLMRMVKAASCPSVENRTGKKGHKPWCLRLG